jgi:hypothetical protein
LRSHGRGLHTDSDDVIGDSAGVAALLGMRCKDLQLCVHAVAPRGHDAGESQSLPTHIPKLCLPYQGVSRGPTVVMRHIEIARLRLRWKHMVKPRAKARGPMQAPESPTQVPTVWRPGQTCHRMGMPLTSAPLLTSREESLAACHAYEQHIAMSATGSSST